MGCLKSQVSSPVSSQVLPTLRRDVGSGNAEQLQKRRGDAHKGGRTTDGASRLVRRMEERRQQIRRDAATQSLQVAAPVTVSGEPYPSRSIEIP